MRGISLRLTHKIAAIGLIGLVGVIVVGGLHKYGDSVMDGYRIAAENARELSEFNNRVAFELVEARRAGKDFLLGNDLKEAEIQIATERTAAADIDALHKKVLDAGKAELARQIDSMRQALQQYQVHFLAVVEKKKQLGLDENSGLEGRLRTSVHNIESETGQLHQPELSVAMLMMRRHEKDFMLRRSPKYGEEMKERAAEFKAGVERAEISPAAKADLAQKLADYQRDFFSWMETALALADAVKATSQSFEATRPIIEAVGKIINESRFEVERSSAEMRETIQHRIEIAILLVILAVLGASVFVARSVSRPLSAMTAAMVELASGNFAVVLPGLGRRDEVGEIAQAVETFKVNAEAKAQAEAEAKIEQDRLGAATRKADMHRLADAFEGAVGDIVQMVSSAAAELEASAHTLTTTAGRSRELATAVAAASEEASTNVQSVASASEELTASVDEIGRHVQESSRVAGAAVEQASQTNARVAELSRAAGRIGDVIELINTIAGQTNLLALNATIEAARAGEAGRGFAVVASEVKALAEQTAKATSEIGQQVTGIQAATEDSVGAIKAIGGTIERMSEISSAIAAAVEEQGAATREISRNIQHAAQGATQVSANIGDVQRGAGETGAASTQVLSAAQTLSNNSNRLKLEVGKFLASVRAA